MATATAHELLTAAGSHHIGFDWDNSRRAIVKEELYPVVLAEWRGEQLRVQLSASRYRASSDAGSHMTPWNVSLYNARRHEPGEPFHAGEELTLSDVARAKLGDVCKPIVREWLESDEYPKARARALTYGIRRELKEGVSSSYGVERARQLLERYGDELEEGYSIELARLFALADELADGLERDLFDD